MVKAQQIILHVLHANAYVVSEGTDAILIDPGSDQQEDIIAIKKALEGLHLHAILYTHNHYDHIMGGHLFPDVPHYMHEADIKTMSVFGEKARKVFSINFTEPEKVLPLSDTMTFGALHVRVYHTPGHSPGSVSFLIGDDLFTGDTLFAGMHGRTDLGGDMQDMKASLALLGTFPNETKVHPGHGVSTTMGKEKKWMAHIVEKGWQPQQHSI